MLKLERIAKTLNVSVTLRKRERTLNRTMLQALALGTLLHITAFLLFPIVASKFKGSLAVHAPMHVAAHIQDRSRIATEMDQEELSRHYLQPPLIQEKLKLPPAEAAPLSEEPLFDLSFESNPELYLFEDKFRHPLLELLDPLQKIGKALEIQVSGPLSSLPLQGLPDSPVSIPEGIFRTVFQVVLENRTGKIFWQEQKESSSSNEKISKLAAEILKQLQFEKNHRAFTTNGEVEIILSRASS